MYRKVKQFVSVTTIDVCGASPPFLLQPEKMSFLLLKEDSRLEKLLVHAGRCVPVPLKSLSLGL